MIHYLISIMGRGQLLYKSLNILLLFLSFTMSNGKKGKDALKEFDDTLAKLLGKDKIYDGRGSIDAAVWKKGKDGKMTPVYQTAFGMAQSKLAGEYLSNYNGGLNPTAALNFTVDKLMKPPLNVPALKGKSKRNLYRIASNTKSFVGLAAMYMSKKLGLNLDEKIHPNYVDMSRLGSAHKWASPSVANGYISNNFPNAEAFFSKITFRHLLTHTSGLSREVLNGDTYSYGSSRTNTPICPPDTPKKECDPEVRERNWEAWTIYIIQYIMPACGYKDYEEKSVRKSCIPGEYYHYSNAAYSVLALAMDRFLKKKDEKLDLEKWMTEELFSKLGLDDTVFTWVDLNKEQKLRTALGVKGGMDEFDYRTPITDFADHGFKTPPGGIWSTTTDLAKFYLGLDTLGLPSKELKYFTKANMDERSEEDPSQMPTEFFRYGNGFYNAAKYKCGGGASANLLGAWGTVPGYTSYVITNIVKVKSMQYVVVLLRNYNYAGNLNLGIEARKVLCKMLYP